MLFIGGGDFKGVVSYWDLIEYDKLEECINGDTIRISKAFWEEARIYFEKSKRRLLTVIDKNSNIVGFAYDDGIKYSPIRRSLMAMEAESFYMPEQYSRIKMIVITDLNELAWKCYEVFKNIGYELCVIGEKWSWFGLNSGKGYLDYPEYAKLYVYAEGTDIIRENIANGKSVWNQFSFLLEIAKTNEQYYYNEKIKCLVQKGIAVCECYIPEICEKTVDEQQAQKLGINLIEYLSNESCFSEEKKLCLWNIYGKENVIAAKKKGTKNSLRWVPLGLTYGGTLENYRYDKRLYLLGPCIVEGAGCLEMHTLYGQLQELVKNFEYQVVYVTIELYRFDGWKKWIDCLPIREKDIILIINYENWFSLEDRNCGIVDLNGIYNRKNRKSMFCEMPIHTNAEGNRLIAEHIFQQYLINKIKVLSDKKSNVYKQIGELLNQENRLEVYKYACNIKVDSKGKIGSVVMNCNPFTKGHRYLIEYAAAEVDILYVFVVEEDRSFFDFDSRIKMVRKGVIDIPNVVVVPTGNWILSYKTMPVYFEKEVMQEVEVDAQLDLEIFARYIAPNLGISIRYVGDEPLDKVTCQYNQQMKMILPLFNIKLKEIPRLQENGEIVSASKVRRLIGKGKWNELKYLVPESSYEFILDKGFN